MGGWVEEVFYSYYQMAEILTRMPVQANTLERLVEIAMKAMAVHPTRSEALYVLTRYCRMTGKHEAGYTFGKMGLAIPYPKNDILFISEFVYDYALADEVAVLSSWLPGKNDETVTLYELALKGKLLSAGDRARITANIMKRKK